MCDVTQVLHRTAVCWLVWAFLALSWNILDPSHHFYHFCLQTWPTAVMANPLWHIPFMLPVQHQGVRDSACNLLLRTVEHSTTRAKYFPRESMKTKHLHRGTFCRWMSGPVLRFFLLCHLFQFVKTQLNSTCDFFKSEFLISLLLFNHIIQTSLRLLRLLSLSSVFCRHWKRHQNDSTGLAGHRYLLSCSL